MGFVNKYPYVDFHELNADVLIAKVDDASAEAKAAADTVATYNDRLTTVEGDLTPIKSAMPGIASDISDLQHDTGIIDSLITNTINPAIDTLKNEVETPTTGLLDRVTALENQPSTGGVTEYLRFGTSGTPIDWDPRITYTYIDGLIATTASADKTVNIVLVEDNELGTTWYYTLNEGEYQISAGTPRGQFTFVCRKPVFDGNNVVTGHKTCTVTVNKNAATPTYTEVQEPISGGGVSGTFVQGGGVNFDVADYIEYDDYIIVNIRGTVTSPLNAGATIVTGGPTVSNSANAVGVLASLNDYNTICVAYSTNGSIVIRPALATGDTFYISIMVIK